MSAQRPGSGSGRSILLALGADPREEPLLAAMERTPGSVRVVRRCLDVADLLIAAESGLAGVAGVAVVSPALARLDAVAVARLRGAGLDIVALVERSDDASAARLRAVGVDQILPVEGWVGAESAGTDLLANLVALLTRELVGDVRAALPGSPQASNPPVLAHLGDPWVPAAREGRLVAVWGPVGAPGRSTVAVTVADELARLQAETLLADADTYGPCLGQMLGILDEASGLAAAARAANSGTLDVEALAACARLLRPGLRVLTGVTRADRWPELPAAALGSVWRTARSLAVWTVVDCAFCLELDEEISFDTAAPRRNGATLVTLQSADVVLAVGGADPIGLQRLIRMLPELRSAAPQAEVRVVVNQVRRGPVGAHPERRLLESLERYAGVTSAVFVPADRGALDAALGSGRTLAEAAAASPARTALLVLASALERQ